MNFIKILEKYVFPPALYCIACGAIIDSSRTYMLCDDCMKNFSWNTGATCHTCGKALGPVLSSAIEAGIYRSGDKGTPLFCYDCMKVQHCFSRGYSCLSYGSIEKTPIISLKYGEQAYIGKMLGEMLCDRLFLAIETEYYGEIPWDIIVPVPIHITRILKRGYNQAEIIGRKVAESIGIPMDTGILTRKRTTGKMKGTSEDRIKNIEGAFAITEKALSCDVLRNKTVLLIDDVYTTGATADECSRMLMNAGAQNVQIATIASGSNYYSSSS